MIGHENTNVRIHSDMHPLLRQTNASVISSQIRLRPQKTLRNPGFLGEISDNLRGKVCPRYAMSSYRTLAPRATRAPLCHWNCIGCERMQSNRSYRGLRDVAPPLMTSIEPGFSYHFSLLRFRSGLAGIWVTNRIECHNN